MVVKNENIPEQAAKGMMDDMMCQNPCQLLQMVMQTEKSEIALYREIAQCIPSPCLRETIMSFTEKETGHGNVYSHLARVFGCMDMPCMPPGCYAAGEKKADKK